jgi:hypothetical protein
MHRIAPHVPVAVDQESLMKRLFVLSVAAVLLAPLISSEA